MPQQDNPEITVEIHALAHGGAGIGDIVKGPENLLGKKAFIRETVPGESVEARVTQDRKNFIEARLTKVLNPSPERQTPPCPVFGICGGCDIQHMTLKAQREAKRAMAESMLARQARLTPAEGVTLIGEELPGLHYRGRIILHLSKEGALGFYKSQSNEVVDIEFCPITALPLNAILKTIKPHIVPLRRAVEEVSIELLDHPPGASLFLELVVTANTRAPSAGELKGLIAALSSCPGAVRLEMKGKVLLEKELLPEAKHYPTGHFAQVNSGANALLQQTVLDLVETQTVSDLYGGAGNFALVLAEHGHEVDLVEADQKLVNYALRLKENKQLPEKALQLFTMRCENFVKRHKLRESVVLDPPRGGAADVVPFFKTELTQRVIYVSCNLPALCRDLKALCAQGFNLRKALVLDMFPQTHFAEIVAVLDR